ncbi:hypothetical protein [Hymenobacter persicinus]|uniref:Uncharacterized protein n=1 Tax=Hymenobacter persicinus TaxID=2025506 RepID=A0A4Q5LK72_9BACT|nr:hypothetical protein [Hymenobacter persicinus]RYU84422.1 hypothetical protein EWM57_01660 [Hymenobacter persicinus]
MTEPRQLPSLPAAAALAMLQNGETLRGYHVVGRLDFTALAIEATYVRLSIRIQHCRLDELQGSMLTFEQPVELHDTHLTQAEFVAAYFLRGLVLDNC